MCLPRDPRFKDAERRRYCECGRDCISQCEFCSLFPLHVHISCSYSARKTSRLLWTLILCLAATIIYVEEMLLCRMHVACNKCYGCCSCCHIWQGYHGDTSRMFSAGKPSDRAQWLCDVNREALYEGIKQCGPGVPINAIGKVRSPVGEYLCRLQGVETAPSS